MRARTDPVFDQAGSAIATTNYATRITRICALHERVLASRISQSGSEENVNQEGKTMPLNHQAPAISVAPGFHGQPCPITEIIPNKFDRLADLARTLGIIL